MDFNFTLSNMYWIVRKVRADFERKLKRRRLKFLILFIKFKSFAALSGQSNRKPLTDKLKKKTINYAEQD